MPNLLELDLSFNQFKQIEHVGIWRQCHLKRLSASFNLFYREITESPKNISECSHYALERLDLRMSLHGTFPEPLGRLENLRSIDLSNNRLIGPIPKSLTRLRFLELNGSIPETFGKLVALTELELQSNRLTGCIPASLGRVE
ncbi:hypothetical protein L1887_25675 [Cichorium endivia]|nr:hypothetical protein L1887_25675 [Cichorium endivia]